MTFFFTLTTNTMKPEMIQPWLNDKLRMALDYAPRVLLILLLLWVGLRVVKLIGKGVERTMAGRGVEPTLRRFIGSLVNIALRVLLFVTVIQMLGVATTSFVAIIGAAGLAVGLALQGTLANFAGGVLVLLFKPYKVGDLIDAQGQLGTVKEIQIFTTVLLTPENKTVIVPNGAAANGIITNYTAEGRIRVDCTLCVARHSDVARAREVLLPTLLKDPKVLHDPAPSITMSKQLPGGVELAVRPYCHPNDYWDVYFATLENGLSALATAGIQGPTPEHKVYVQNT